MEAALATMRDLRSRGAGAGAALGDTGSAAAEPAGVESAPGSVAHPPRVRATPKASKAEFNVCSGTRVSAPSPSNDPIITSTMDSIDTQFATRRNGALQPGMLQAALLDRLTRALGKNPDQATPRDIYDALSLAVREELTLRWLAPPRGGAWRPLTSNAFAIFRSNICRADPC